MKAYSQFIDFGKVYEVLVRLMDILKVKRTVVPLIDMVKRDLNLMRSKVVDLKVYAEIIHEVFRLLN